MHLRNAALVLVFSFPLLSPTTALAGDETVISGRVWEDDDRNGIDDDGTHVEGVVIQLRTLGGVVIDSGTTDASGDYTMTTQASGAHVLRVFPPSGFLLTHANVGAAFEDSDFDRSTATVEVQLIGGSITDMDAGIDERDQLAVPQGTIDFGEVASTGGGGVTRPVELANLGERAAEVDSLGLINNSTWNWSLGTCPAVPFVLAAGASCQLELTATPSSAGSFSLAVSAGTSWNQDQSNIGSMQMQGITVRFVDGAATGANNGSSWLNAHRSLSEALDALDVNEKLWVRSGIYPAVAGPFSAATRVRLAGGFAGTESGLIERDLEVNAPTVLSGDLAGDDLDPDGDGLIASPADIRGTNAERIVSMTQNLTLDGVVISAADGDVDGAAIMATGSLTLDQVRIVGNRGASAVWKDGTGGRIVDSGFEHNHGTALVLNQTYNATITSSRFVGNRSPSMGGAIRALNAVSPGIGFSLELRSVLVAGNHAAAGGGLYFDGQEIPALGGCFGSRDLERDALGGGGCDDVSGRLVISRSTFAGNTAEGDGGALWLDLADLPNPLGESLFWRHADSSGVDTPSAVVHYDDAFQASFETSDVGGSGGSGSWNAAFGTDGGGNLDLDPLFVNDVPSSQSSVDHGDYRLWASSPVLDLGSMTPTEPTDAAGNDRVDGPAADLGAFEGQVAGIYGRVWRDIDGDGIQDANEPGRANVAVSITSPVTVTTTTDANGNFRFADLPAGSYDVSLTPPDGFEASPRDQGDDTTDSDFDPLGIAVLVDEDSTDIDGGLIFTGLFMDDFELGETSAWALSSP